MLNQEKTNRAAASDGKLTSKRSAVADLVTRGRKNPLWMGLPRRLLHLREGAGLTLMELGEIASVAHSTIRNIELGRTSPGIDTAERIAAALGVSPCWFAFGPEGDSPFRQKLPQSRLIPGDPDVRVGLCDFMARYQGCSARVQALRQEKGFTLRGLAELANKRMTRRHKTRTSAISYQVVYNTEAGRNAPRVDTLEAIALALDVSACFLAYGEEPTSEVAAGDPPKAA